MRRDPRAYLWDAVTAADAIMEFTRGRSLEAYLADGMPWHDYATVDHREVWATVQDDLPAFATALTGFSPNWVKPRDWARRLGVRGPLSKFTQDIE